MPVYDDVRELVSLVVLTIRADHGPFTPQNGTDGAWNDTVPIQVAASKKITAASNGNRQIVRLGIGMGDQVGA